MFLKHHLFIGFFVCWLLFGFPLPGYAAVPGNLENDILYYIVVDRFLDGELDNNIPDYAFPSNTGLNLFQEAYNQANRSIAEASFDPTRQYASLRWGGDLEGVIQKLDYLQDLGITKLVLSPIQDSINGLIFSPFGSSVLHQKVNPDDEAFDRFHAGSSAGFQGYWLKDWFEVDEHFRSPDDERGGDRLQTFTRLLNAAGERGIKIILTLPLNGTSPYQDSEEFPQFDISQFQQWFVDGGGVYRHGKKIATYWDPDRSNPQDWFHSPVSINYKRPTAKALENAAVGGIPDFNQENPEVRQYLLDAAKFWLTVNPGGHQVAGFYLTQIPNINLSFWQEFERAILSVNPEAILIGEYPDGGYQNPQSMDWFERTQHYGLLNYSLSLSARRFFGRDRAWDGRTAVLRKLILGREGIEPLGSRLFHRALNISNVLEIPQASLDAASDEKVRGWVSFIENRDLPRLQTASPQVSDVAYSSLIKFIFTSPGVPMLMYGVETGLAVPYHIDHRGLLGIGNDPYNQPMMIWSEDLGWNPDLHATVRKLIQLRRDCSALRYGRTQFLFPEGSRRDADLFMLREPFNGSEPMILYAYSTFGGEFHLPQFTTDSLDIEALDELESLSLASKYPVLKLKPEQSVVLILSPA
ncbi:MAG: alpha-amylase family glycosyl hydrolase [Cyanobacteria bacterium J06641_5]